MIRFEKDIFKLKAQVYENIHKLESIKDFYCKNKDLQNYEAQEDNEAKIMRLKIFEIQIIKIDNTLDLLNSLLDNNNLSVSEKERLINKINKKYSQINSNFIRNSTNEKSIEIENELPESTQELGGKFKNNDTLLISEVLKKVILPYTVEEIESIVKSDNNSYQTYDEVVNNVFTRDLADFKFQFVSRYKETMKLAMEREKYSFSDAVTLSLEMLGKKYLHPAIIAACRNLDELDVYLDCLDKNELDDFKIFKIKYELHPLLIKNNSFSNLKKINIFGKKQRKKGLHAY